MPTLFNGCGCGPPLPFTAASAWTRIDHPVSGPRLLTIRPFQAWFPCGSAPPALSLARNRDSPDRSTKSTRLGLGTAKLCRSPPTVRRRGVSGSLSLPSRGPFHLSLTVLYAIGHQGVSQPWGVVPPPSHRVPRVLWYSGSCPYGVLSAYGAFTLCGRSFQYRSASKLHSVGSPYPETFPKVCLGLGFSAFARRYSRSLV